MTNRRSTTPAKVARPRGTRFEFGRGRYSGSYLFLASQFPNKYSNEDIRKRSSHSRTFDAIWICLRPPDHHCRSGKEQGFRYPRRRPEDGRGGKQGEWIICARPARDYERTGRTRIADQKREQVFPCPGK